MNTKNQLIRQNFYQGQSVSPNNLNMLQNYTDCSQAHTVASLLGYGIVQGFEMTHSDDFIITITNGLAFNQEGTQLVLSNEHQVNISSHAPTLSEEKIIKLGVIHDWSKSEPVLNSMGKTINTQWTPTVQFVVAEQLEDAVFELAEVTLNPTRIVKITKTGEKFQTLPNHILNTAAFTTHIDEEGTSHAYVNKVSIETIIKNIAYPIHSFYTQYTDHTGNFVVEEEPSQLFGGVWEIQFNENAVFFRTEGNNANEHRTNGVQYDAIRNITGKVGATDANTGPVNYIDGYNGCFNTSDKTNFRRSTNYYDTLTNRAKYITFDASSVVPTGSENRPINMLIRIWKRVA